MRSLLFVPADDERKLAKALDSGADALILDLEDSISADAKAHARERLAAFLASAPPRPRRPKLYVRVNALSTGLADDDLDAAVAHPPDGIMLPKSLGADSVEQLSVKLAAREAERGLKDGATSILARTASSRSLSGDEPAASRASRAKPCHRASNFSPPRSRLPRRSGSCPRSSTMTTVGSARSGRRAGRRACVAKVFIPPCSA